MNTRKEEDQRIAEALNFAGLKVSSVFDLVNTRQSYGKAITVLVKLLPTLHDPVIKEGVVRALAVKEARKAAVCPLIEEYKNIDPSDQKQELLRWSVANTLSVIAEDPEFDEIASLLRDPQNGKSREMLAVALGNMKKSPQAIDVLMEMLGDDIVAGYAAMALGKLKATQAVPALEKLLDHPKEWVRKEAERAIKKAGKGSKHA